MSNNDLEMRLDDREEVNVSVDQARCLRSEREDSMDQSLELRCSGNYNFLRNCC